MIFLRKGLIVFIVCFFNYIFGENLEKSLVKIFTISNEYNYEMPWQPPSQYKTSGSGFILKDKSIITNAHVIADAAFIEVKLNGEANKYIAEIDTIANEYDLALLKVQDASFFQNASYLEIADDYNVRDRIAVFGFPMGGSELCITEGIISRNQMIFYWQSSCYLLAAQIDSAINPGNSGGPVISMEGKVVGVVHQSMFNSQNIGYMIPINFIQHFLKQIKEGKYLGVPQKGITTQTLENPYLRQFYLMKDSQSGILVNDIQMGSIFKDSLFPHDIILEIDDVPLANDGTIAFKNYERILGWHLLNNKMFGDEILITVLREGKIVKLKIKIEKDELLDLVPFRRHNKPPEYYIYGGFVFQPLDGNYLRTFGDKWYKEAPEDLLYYFYYGKAEKDRKEIVLLTQVLPDKYNIGYQDLYDLIITEINGKKISMMKDVIEALEKGRNSYHVINTEGGLQIILNKDVANYSHKSILNKYEISSDRSKDLK